MSMHYNPWTNTMQITRTKLKAMKELNIESVLMLRRFENERKPPSYKAICKVAMTMLKKFKNVVQNMDLLDEWTYLHGLPNKTTSTVNSQTLNILLMKLKEDIVIFNDVVSSTLNLKINFDCTTFSDNGVLIDFCKHIQKLETMMKKLDKLFNNVRSYKNQVTKMCLTVKSVTTAPCA